MKITLASACLLGALATGLLGAPTADAGRGGAHPYFDDQGTLVWYTTLDEAVTAARASSKAIFIEYGRRECRNCKVLVQRILPSEPTKTRFGALCVGLAADCDAPDPRIETIFARGLPGATALPFVCFVTTDLRWVNGWAGLAGADACSRGLDLVDASMPKSAPPCAAKTAPAPKVPAPPAAPATGPLPMAPTAPTASAPVASAPAVATPAPAMPVASSTTPPPAKPVMPANLPTASEEVAAKARELLQRARAAGKVSRHGEVLRLDTEASGLPLRAEPADWKRLTTTASMWFEQQTTQALGLAHDKKLGDAATLMAEVSRQVAGSSVAKDADRGVAAVRRAQAIEAAPAAERARAMASASVEFRGTRRETLFAR